MIYNSGVNFTVSNSNFINNTGSRGGVICNSGANFRVSNSSFINNTASSGGGIWSSGASCTVNNSSFINNTANDYGGAIYHNGGVNFILSNSSFINNTAKGYGGGAIRNSGAMNFTVSNSEFINNTAPNSDGGAIYNNGASCIVSNTTFTNNTATQGVAIYNNDGGSINLTDNEYSEIVSGKTYIYNDGTIISPVILTVLGNQTVNGQYGENVVLFATITADGASVGGQTLIFNINNTSYSAITNDDGNYTYNNYTSDFIGVKSVNATYAGASNITVQNSAILSNMLLE